MALLDELPALKNGSTWVSKFRNIVDYLRQYSNGEWDLDGRWNEQERADNIAYVQRNRMAWFADGTITVTNWLVVLL